ncbi:MAG: hypothetical protein HY923_10005 [Elusimicrobia bacterium]|nr:hypothetical protein [Elusimicrobiota bacterium]
MRRPLRPAFSALLCAAFFVQSTGAADLAPIFARGAMLPPPGRMAPLPMPGAVKPVAPKQVAPQGEPWLASAIVVARWVNERLTGTLNPAPALTEMPSPEALAAYASVARNEVSALAAAAAPEPPVDRMLILMEGRRVVASGLAAQLASILQYRSELKPLRPRFVGEWVGSGPVRARVDYLRPFGVTQGEAKGYRVTLADGYERLIPTKGAIPPALMRELPLYFAGDLVDVEITVLNTGKEPLNNLQAVAVQEDYMASGEAGAPTSSPMLAAISSLAAGQTTVLRWRVKLSSTAREAVNFEQTHLRVLGKDPAGGEKVLLDQNQAGLIDPPGE